MNRDGLNRKMEKLRRIKQEVMPKAYQTFIENTPVDTGNARRNSKLINFIIRAKYPYVLVLNDGRRMTNKGMKGSSQSPDGMAKPTIARIPKLVKDYARSI